MKKLILAIVIAGMFVQFIPLTANASPIIDGNLITSKEQYKLYGYDPALIDDPVIYEEQAICEGHLPMALTFDIATTLTNEKDSFLSSREVSKVNISDIDYTYRILQPYIHEESVPNWEETTDKNGTEVSHLIGYNTIKTTRYHWVEIKDLAELKIEKSKYYIVDIQGNFKADIGTRSVDVIPKVQIGTESKEFSEYAWWDPNWAHRVKVYVIHDYFDTKLENFPVLVTIYDEVGDPMDGGDSIRFLGMDNATEYDFEIENWTSNDWCYIWVEIPTIYADRNTTFWMYYGNPAAPDGQDKHGTWNSEYMAVWHWNDNASDSTINNWDLTPVGTPTFAPMMIAGGVHLDGEDPDYFMHDTLLDVIPASGEITFMIWENPDTLVNTMYTQRKRSSGTDQIAQLWVTGNNYDFIVETDNIVRAHLDFGGLYTASMWQMITHTHKDNDFQHGWYNITKSIDGDGNGVLDDGTDYDFFIGYSGAGNPYFGSLDETRLSSIRRNDSWIKAEYYTCNLSANATNGTIIQFGATDDVPVGEAEITVNVSKPLNNSLGICPCCIVMCVNVTNSRGHLMNVSFWVNTSYGTDLDLGVSGWLWHYTNVSNGTICAAYGFQAFNHTVRWNVTVQDMATGSWENSSFYYFTTLLSEDAVNCLQQKYEDKISNESWILPIAMVFMILPFVFAISKRRK